MELPPVAVAVTLVINGDDENSLLTPMVSVPPVAVAVTWSIENDPLVTLLVYNPKLVSLPPPVLLMVR